MINMYTIINIANLLNQIDDFMYFPFLVIILVVGGLYFTLKTRGVQIRLLYNSIKLMFEPKKDKNSVSSLEAMLVSTASRIGTGNIIGVSTAICLGGPGACFWMWLMCIIGGSSAFIESTLAQIFKKKDEKGNSYGGPAYYIEQGLNKPKLAMLFCIFLILAYAIGFNMLCSYNIQSTFIKYPFYNENTTPIIIGAILAILTGYCIIGGGKRIINITTKLVPLMGISYVAIALIIIILNFKNIPSMFILIFQDAFNFQSIFGGFTGSCLVYGIKRGLFSNEAGVGSAPNASASAIVSHPVKQGLLQTISVYIDTLILCTATALMRLCTGIMPDASLAGASYVQNSIQTVLGNFGPIFLTIVMILFGFTTLIGNIYYINNTIIFLNKKKKPSKRTMKIIHIFCALIVFIGATIPMSIAWSIADITMGCMTIINIPTCILLSKFAINCLHDYENQRKQGKDPVFKGVSIGLNEKSLDFWK